MKKLLFFLLLGATAQAQISSRCIVCPPTLVGATHGSVLRDSSGQAIWQVLSGLDTNAVDVNTLNYWGLQGNSGTDPATNFIGTTDSVGFVIKNYCNQADNSIFINGSNVLDDANSIGAYILGQAVGEGQGLFIYGLSQNYNAVNIQGNASGAGYDITLNPINQKLQINLAGQANGAVLTSDSNGLASWGVTSFTTSDSATIYALTPANGTTYFCSDCSGSGVTGRIVSYFGSLWRRLKFD